MGDSGKCEKRTIGDVVPYDPYQKPEVSGLPTFKVRIKSRLNLPHRRLNSQNVKALLNKKRKGIFLPQLVDISELGLNRKIKKFNGSFLCGKGYSPLSGKNIFLSTV